MSVGVPWVAVRTSSPELSYSLSPQGAHPECFLAQLFASHRGGNWMGPVAASMTKVFAVHSAAASWVPSPTWRCSPLGQQGFWGFFLVMPHGLQDLSSPNRN